MQSKNGGLAAWEPAGAAEWLEVRIVTNWSHVLVKIFQTIINVFEIIISRYYIFSLFYFLQLLNPTEFFADIVIEYEYVECTSSAIQALVLFMKLYPGHRNKEIEHFITNATQYLENIQMADGSWYSLF